VQVQAAKDNVCRPLSLGPKPLPHYYSPNNTNNNNRAWTGTTAKAAKGVGFIHLSGTCRLEQKKNLERDTRNQHGTHNNDMEIVLFWTHHAGKLDLLLLKAVQRKNTQACEQVHAVSDYAPLP
jgi:hypothetical protein